MHVMLFAFSLLRCSQSCSVYPRLHIYVVTAVSAVLIVNVQMVYSVLNYVWEIVYWCCYTDIKARCDTMANDIIH